jgi:hypothetical protein
MLEIAELNSKTSNNNIRLAAAALVVNIAKLVAIALAIPVIVAPLKRSACKAIRGRAASKAS